MTTPAEIAAESATSAFDLAALIPLGAVLSLIGVLIAAAWAARSAMIVRLLDSQRAAADRFAAYQQDAVAAINELGLSMARYIEQAQDAVKRGAADAIKAAPEPAPDQIKFDVSLDPEWQARVTRATDAWRLILARGHAFAGNGVHDALAAVDEQRAVVVGHLNKHRFGDAKSAVDRLREYESRQVYRRLQVVALEREVTMMRLVQTRRLRREMKRAEAFAIEQLQRGEQMIADAEREHRNGGTPQTGA
ncbi:hypothetical protein BOH66_11360 [Microbacterium aurum]|uniref:Uncharacterized protein n=1 Tax=Microbacterium aurum TaxID=36805 RepID=A0A1P8U9E8_9MICO|nr:hypothetical protein [Microbacterium aurum]APZ34774.1 hypothetical protein BOH66_11360 [Microbacterium aurum]MBM7828681.1 hypothetical protein [Microbacterium aurum]